MTRPAPAGRVVAVAVSLLLPLALGVVLLTAWQRGFQAALAGPYGQTVNDVILGELLPGMCPGQTFVADAPGLYRVDVMLATYQRTNTGPLVLHVRAAPFAADWATATVDMAGVADNAFHTFTFDPLPLPAGVPAYFCLEAPAAQPGNAITLLPRRADAYPGGRALWADGTPLTQAADLTFRLFYQPGARWAVAAGLERVAAGKPGVLAWPPFYTGLFGTFVVLLLALTAALTHAVLTGRLTGEEPPPA